MRSGDMLAHLSLKSFKWWFHDLLAFLLNFILNPFLAWFQATPYEIDANFVRTTRRPRNWLMDCNHTWRWVNQSFKLNNLYFTSIEIALCHVYSNVRYYNDHLSMIIFIFNKQIVVFYGTGYSFYKSFYLLTFSRILSAKFVHWTTARKNLSRQDPGWSYRSILRRCR